MTTKAHSNRAIMLLFRPIALILALFVVLGTSNVLAKERYALVIGVDNYANIADIPNARNDAQAIAQTFDEIGFKVTLVSNPGYEAFNEAILNIADRIEVGDEVVFYFSGHGIEVDGENYLLPADVPSGRPSDSEAVLLRSFRLDRVLRTLQRRSPRTMVVILDACRDNPFENVGDSSGGLASINPPQGSFVLFSADAGETAMERLSPDDTHPNSLFTRKLLPLLREPGRPLGDIVDQLSAEVRSAAAEMRHRQFPFSINKLYDQDYSLNPGHTPPPHCEQVDGTFPFVNRNGEVVTMGGVARNIGFGDAANVCIGESIITVRTDRLDELSCQAILNSPHGGIGHKFSYAGKNYEIWFYINSSYSPRTLEIGLYERPGNDKQYYWIATNVPICNG